VTARRCKELKIMSDQAIQARAKLSVREEGQGLPPRGLLPPRNEIPEPFRGFPGYQAETNSLPCIREDGDRCGGAPGWGGPSRRRRVGDMRPKSQMIQRKPAGKLVTYH